MNRYYNMNQIVKMSELQCSTRARKGVLINDEEA